MSVVRMRHATATFVAATMLLIAGCSDDNDAAGPASTDGSAASAPASDLAEGAFERNEGSAEPAPDPADGQQVSEANDTAVATTFDGAGGEEPGDDVGGEVDSNAQPADGVDETAAPGDAEGTTNGDANGGGETSGGESVTDSAADASVGDNGRTADGNGETDGGANQADGGPTTSDGAPPTGGATIDGGSDNQPGSGRIRAGSTEYVFDVIFCEAATDYIEITGEGELPNGDEFVVEVTHEIIDIDDDGQDDELFDLLVDYVTEDGRDDAVPELFTSKVDSADTQQGVDVELTRGGNSLSGTGSIVDFNGVAIPSGQSAPMEFEIRCA